MLRNPAELLADSRRTPRENSQADAIYNCIPEALATYIQMLQQIHAILQLIPRMWGAIT